MEAAEDADPRGKRDPRDFALWKGRKKESEPETASWPSPWGRGRPGWHIECSAMAEKYLGPAFDIHGGGVDLRFPHHENEQAQSRAAGHPFASYWMHNAWITTAGEKMSKSLGNTLSIPSVLQRVRGIELRFYMVAAHYRSHVEFSFEALEEAAVGLPPDRELPRARGRPDGRAGEMPAGLRRRDGRRPRHARPRSPSSTTPCARATACWRRPTTAAPIAGAGRARCSTCSASIPPTRRGGRRRSNDQQLTDAVDVLVRGLLEQRAQARADKDFAAADAIRDQIKAAGIEITDTPDGPTWSLEAGTK